MQDDDLRIQRELLAFDEKMALAELEESKAHERLIQIKYEKSRYILESFLLSVKKAQDGSPA
jgi:hypothetical protein